MSDAMVATDGRFRIVEYNRAFRELAMLPERLERAVPLPDVLPVEPLLERARELRPRSRRRVLAEWQCNTPKRRCFEVVINRIRSGRQQSGYLFLFRDVTEQKRLEQMKSRFFTFASHELQAPLQGLLGFLHLMYQGLKDRLDAEERRHFEFLIESGENLRLMTEDLLRLSPREGSRSEKKVARLDSILLDALRRVNVDIQALGLNIRKEGAFDAEICGDIEMMVKAFESILKVFTLYCRPEATLWIRGKLTGRRIQLEFFDPDLPVEETDIREMLQGGEATGDRLSHLGLGLALARDVLEWLGGGLSLAEEPFLKMIVTIPVKNHSTGGKKEE
jgi:signal transduction histidine kinase